MAWKRRGGFAPRPGAVAGADRCPDRQRHAIRSGGLSPGRHGRFPRQALRSRRPGGLHRALAGTTLGATPLMTSSSFSRRLIMGTISYQLWIALRHPRTSRSAAWASSIFRPASMSIPAARKATSRRASRGIAGSDKTLRWHIDYLLAAEGVELFCVGRSTRGECALNRGTWWRAYMVPGFGASDCRKACGSHLRYLGGETHGRLRLAAARGGVPRAAPASLRAA
jgi:Uri superfamily endonuclease